MELFLVHFAGIGSKQIIQKSVSEGDSAEDEEGFPFFFDGATFFCGDCFGLPLFFCGDDDWARFCAFSFRFFARSRKMETFSVEVNMALSIDFRPRLLLGLGPLYRKGPTDSTAELKLFVVYPSLCKPIFSTLFQLIRVSLPPIKLMGL